MACCKDNLLLYVKIEPHQKADKLFLKVTKNALIEALDFEEEQANQVINYAIKNGRCLVLEGTMIDIGKVTTLLAKNHISAEVENKSIK